MSGEEIFHLSVSELAKRIEAKKLSPVELTQIYLDRSQKLGPRYNAYALLTPEIALEQAKAAEKEIGRGHYRGPLHGIPYAAKDLLAVKGLPTTWGAKPYANQVFDYNATVIDHLRGVGAVMVGKAAMIELAGGMGYRFASASLQGEAKNPWDTTCWTCGSSSGSGAIVAAGLAAFAIGTETWGSIICPSAFCGVSGLRPTYGRVSRYGRVSELTDPLGQIAGYVNEQYTAADYLQALKVREIVQKKMDSLFDAFDVIAAAAQPVPATPLTLNLEIGLTFPDPLGAIGNICGLPAMSVPCGFTEKNLPVGLQFVGRAGDDFAVIQAGRTFQLHTDWHKRHPKIH